MRNGLANTRRMSAKRGFTLLEVLLVLAILVALAALAVPRLIGVQESSKISEAKLQVSALDSAANMYNVKFQNFPQNDLGLRALAVAPNPKPDGWFPIMTEGDISKKDPWGAPYSYQYPGTRNTIGGPDIWSNGPDRQSGTADDIGNWGITK